MPDTKLRGSKELQATLRKLGKNAPKEAAKALYVEAQEIMSDSKANYVPVDTSRLKNSGSVLKPEIKGSGVSVKLGFNTEYAIYVHERLDVHHPVGQAKYLEKPLLKAKRSMNKRLASRIKLSKVYKYRQLASKIFRQD